MSTLESVIGQLPNIEQDQKILISLSGGLDSTILLHLLVSKYGKNNVVAVSFNYGQRHNIELEMAKQTIKRLNVEHHVLDISFFGDIVKTKSALVSGSDVKLHMTKESKEIGETQPSSYVPFRNLMFASLQASMAETHNCRYIAQGLQKQDYEGYWDCRPSFVDALNNVFNQNTYYPLNIITPFVNLTKADELKLAKELSNFFGFDVVEFTWSCYTGDDGDHKQCGKCLTCNDSINAYKLAGFDENYILNKFKN